MMEHKPTPVNKYVSVIRSNAICCERAYRTVELVIPLSLRHPSLCLLPTFSSPPLPLAAAAAAVEELIPAISAEHDASVHTKRGCWCWRLVEIRQSVLGLVGFVG
ncbi:hypothetical protein GUJ93_ZPchr0013g36364 [Zizania palustris]|uniref:Uncharacterized protein n=1 Tax=Zizania palustris TaxID=103762 RepID=A0A8J5X4I0_ZIZPA|nr:hypothetical protein GUJ93_ZPchr0013g36364 [Zizania palustris]